MDRIDLNDFKAYVKTLEGKRLETKARGKVFTVEVGPSGFRYTPQSTGTPRTNTYKAVQNVFERFQSLQSFQPGDYHDLTVNASYLLAILEMYLAKKRTNPSAF